MKLNVVFNLDGLGSLYLPAFQSLQEGIQHQWKDSLRVFLVRQEELGSDYSTAQLRSLQQIEDLVSSEYSGTTFIGCSIIEALGQVSLVFPDQPVTWLSPYHSIGIDSVRYLVSDLWHEGSNAVLMSPISQGLLGRTPHRLNKSYFADSDRKIDINFLAVLRDLSLSSFNLIWPGYIFKQVSDDALQILKRPNSGKCDEILLVQWILLCNRVRLAELSISIIHPRLSDQESALLGFSEKDALVHCLSLLSETKQNALLEVLLAVLIDTVSDLADDCYQRLQSGTRCIGSYRKLFNRLWCSLAKHISSSFLPELIIEDAPPSLFSSILHHGYFDYAGSFYSRLDDSSSYDYSELIRPLINSALASSVYRGLEKLPPRKEPVDVNSGSISWSFEDSSLPICEWLCLSETRSEETGAHAARFDISAAQGQILTVCCIAASYTLNQITLVIPAQCAGEEIRVNFDLREKLFAAASGNPIAIEMAEVSPDVCVLQVTARVEANFIGSIQLRTCKNNTSYYKPSGSGSVYFSCVEYSLSTSNSSTSCSVSSFTQHRSEISVLDQNSSGTLPFIFKQSRMNTQTSPTLSIRLDASNYDSCVLSCKISPLSCFSLARVNASGAATVLSQAELETPVTNSEDHPQSLLTQAWFETRGIPNDLKLEFESCIPLEQFSGLAPKLIISYLSLQAARQRIGSPKEADPLKQDRGEQLLVSVIAVAYKMHHLIPGWLSNYALQSIHKLGQRGAELLIADVELSLPLLIYVLTIRIFANLTIRLVPFEADPGLYESWNSLIRLSRAKFITNFNPDDRKLPDHLGALCLLLEETDAQVASSACHVLRFEPGDSIPVTSSDISALEEKWWVGNHESSTLTNLTTGQLYREPEPGHYKANNMLHSMPVWRRSLHSHHGFFDEAIYGTYADYAFWISVLSAGEQGLFIDIPLYLFSVVRESHNRVNANPGILEHLVNTARLSS